MVRSLFCLSALVCATVLGAENVPTPADATTSVLKTTASEATASPTPASNAVATTAPCCEVVREVALGPWQARRLARQADRQEARDARNCCCKCDCEKNCKKTALVTTKKCTCGCK